MLNRNAQQKYHGSNAKTTFGILNIKHIPNCVGWKVAAATDGAGGMPVVT